jgi:hypothetical protein
MYITLYKSFQHLAGDVVTTSGFPSVGSSQLLPKVQVKSISVSCNILSAVDNSLISPGAVSWEALFSFRELSGSFVLDNSLQAETIDTMVRFTGLSGQSQQKRFEVLEWGKLFSSQLRVRSTDLGVGAVNYNAYFWCEIEYTRVI